MTVTSAVASTNHLTHQADGLSLAMFEALRGLRDAVAPVSGEIMQEKNDDEVDDQDLVSKLAHTVLEQSQTIQRRIDAIPGLHRSRNEQMGRIAELVEENRVAQEELEGCYTRALAQRSQCRTFLQDNTEKALGLSS